MYSLVYTPHYCSSARRPKDYKNFYRPPLVEAMFRANFKVVILDESHYVKNPKARRTENVIDIVKKAERRILLTGTPALARPSELFSQVDAILPGGFSSIGSTELQHWAMYRIPDGLACLDVGCGIGRFSCGFRLRFHFAV